MVYYGQEVGEPADCGAAGFELDKGRTTFFDFWSVPELQKWINGGKYDGGGLSPEQKDLRSFYGQLIRSLRHPALAQGNFYPLNPANGTDLLSKDTPSSISCSAKDLTSSGFLLPDLPPLSAAYFDLK